MGETKIEWTDKVWNPVTGCTKVSQGCKNCYAERVFPRAYGKDRKFTDVQCHVDRLADPMSWRKPARVFVNSMSDLFHESVPEAYLVAVFTVMASAHKHAFQVLTKRPQRMLEFVRKLQWTVGFGMPSWAPRCIFPVMARVDDRDWINIHDKKPAQPIDPKGFVNGMPANVWLGVSVEDQKTADERIPLLLQTPAAVRWISAEPLLGPIDLTNLTVETEGGPEQWDCLDKRDAADAIPPAPSTVLDWVVCGGESGPQARPMHPDWARSLRDQCQAAGVPFFFKQWGEWTEYTHYDNFDNYADRVRRIANTIGTIDSGHAALLNADGTQLKNGGPDGKVYPIVHFRRVGKKAAGRLLDGREWSEYPEVRR